MKYIRIIILSFNVILILPIIIPYSVLFFKPIFMNKDRLVKYIIAIISLINHNTIKMEIFWENLLSFWDTGIPWGSLTGKRVNNYWADCYITFHFNIKSSYIISYKYKNKQ